MIVLKDMVIFKPDTTVVIYIFQIRKHIKLYGFIARVNRVFVRVLLYRLERLQREALFTFYVYFPWMELEQIR